MKKINHIKDNPFAHSEDHHRYHTWNYYLRKKFGKKIAKVSLNAGFTCPNIDGKKGFGGCTFCSIKGSGDFAGNPANHIVQQFKEIKENMLKKWPETTQFIAYFQAFTNTYAPVDILKEKFEPILALPEVIGLSIATRADCLDQTVLEYLEDINKRTELWVELGLQTIHDETAKKINRGHTLAEFEASYQQLKDRGIKVCIHLINGLPNETEEMMLKTAQYVAQMQPESIKIHLLHVLKDTPLETSLKKQHFQLMDKLPYCQLVAKQLTYFAPECIIQRLTGDGGADDLIGPVWSLKKFDVLNTIDKIMFEHNLYQGQNFQEK